MHNTTLMVSFLAMAALSSPSLAQEKQTGFSIGLGATISSDPYIGDNENTSAVPLLRYQGRGFAIGTDGAEVTFVKRPNLTLEGLITPRFTALDNPDAIELAGIDRDISADIGLRFTYAITGTLDAKATFLQEVTGEHDGQEIELGLENKIRLGRFPIGLGAGVSWKSGDLGDYLYGVAPSEAVAGRPAYDPGGSFAPYLTISTGIPLSSNTMLIGSVTAEFFDNEITDSPIIDDDVAITGFIGVTYGF